MIETEREKFLRVGLNIGVFLSFVKEIRCLHESRSSFIRKNGWWNPTTAWNVYHFC
jgi:hypothetical protein